MSTNTQKTEETFTNDNITVKSTRDVGCQVTFNITVGPEAVKAARAGALKNINKEVSIPGFRKGKAPAALIEKNFSGPIEREWKDVLLNTSFREAMALAKIYPFKEGSVKKATVNNISLDTGADLTIEFESSPSIPTINFSDLKVSPVELKQITDENVNEALERLRMERATWNEITDRPAEENDYVEIDIDVISEPARNVVERGKFQIAPKKMEAWMRRLIIGKKGGETSEGQTEKPEPEECNACTDGSHDHHHEEEKFEPVTCRITIHSIQQPTLPAVDDELAKAYGAADLADFKDKIAKSLASRAEEEQKNALRGKMQAELLNKYVFDLPLSMITQELSSHRRPIINDLRQSGTPEEEIPAKLKEIETQLLARLDREMRLYLLTHNITQTNNIAVSENEAMMEWLQHNWMQQMGQKSSRLPEDPKEAIETIKSQLLVVKMLDFLLEKASA